MQGLSPLHFLLETVLLDGNTSFLLRQLETPPRCQDEVTTHATNSCLKGMRGQWQVLQSRISTVTATLRVCLTLCLLFSGSEIHYSLRYLEVSGTEADETQLRRVSL